MTKCTECNGRGHFLMPMSSPKCEACNGTGVMLCDGRGWLLPDQLAPCDLGIQPTPVEFGEVSEVLSGLNACLERLLTFPHKFL